MNSPLENTELCFLLRVRVCRISLTDRLVFAILLAAVIAVIHAPQVNAAEGYPSWAAGKAIPLAVDVGPLGATRDYEAQPLGTADVFGNGPYDLFLRDRKLFPFKRFLPDGTPVYGQPQNYKISTKGAALVSDPHSGLFAVYPRGKSLRVEKFDAKKLRFDRAEEFPVSLSKGARSFAASLTPAGRLLAAFSVSDGAGYSPNEVHLHSAEFRPFDGAGIWRGGMSYSGLGAAMFAKGLSPGPSEVKFPVFAGGRDFLFGNPGNTIVNLGPGRERDVLASDNLGSFRYYHNRGEEAIDLEPAVFISDEQGNALRHPGIHPAPAALPDPRTGQSNLLVGDTGQLWFYKFKNRFNEQGGPIYAPPVRALVEAPKMVLSALPVVTAGDLDSDGLVDLVAGTDVGDFYFIRNIGSSKVPGFDVPQPIMAGGEVLKINAGYGGIQGPGEARWGYTCPTLFDWNGDGLLDILYNSIQSDVTVVLHKPGTSLPEFQKPVVLKCDSLELRLVWRTQPAVTDWGHEGGVPCIIVNDEKNQFRRFWRIDDYNVRRGEVLRLASGQPIQANSKRFSGQLGRTKLQAVDWDGDGAIDLIAGTGRAASIPGKGGIPDDTFTGDKRQASVLLLRNLGSNDEPVFEYPRLIHFAGEKIALGTHTCSPLAVDLGRGELDLLVGMEQGVVIYYPREELTWPKSSRSAE